jgi:hypothetical protein
MTIKFICSCGKHLKARDEMAARRSVCPRCGSPVGVPSLKPTHPGTDAAPMTPQERLRHARENKLQSQPFPDNASFSSGPPIPVNTSITTQWDRVVQLNPPRRDQPVVLSTPRGVNPDLVTVVSSKRTRRQDLQTRQLERHWSECLVYPFRVWKWFFGLALLLTISTVAALFSIPEMAAEMEGEMVLLFWGPILVLVLGGACAFLDCVLASALAGEVYYIVWSGNPLRQMFFSGVKWLMCLLAGPGIFAVTGWLYWLRCGDPGVIDLLMLTELGVIGLGWWIFVLLSWADRGRLRDLNPFAVIDLIHRLGWRRMLAVLAFALLLLANARFLIAGVAGMHESWFFGWLIVSIGWGFGMYCSTFFCRVLGLWCRQSRPAVD